MKKIKIPDELYWKHKKWKKAFRDEFGIHFKNSPDELKFALTFIEELLEKVEKDNKYWAKSYQDLKTATGILE